MSKGEKHMRHKIRCASKPAFGNKRAQSGEAMAGGAADWNEGVRVGVGPRGKSGVFSEWICQNPKRDVPSFPISSRIHSRLEFFFIKALP